MTALNSEGLLPCPFCGSTDIYTEGPCYDEFMCNDCGISQNDQNQDRSGAISAWNRRALPPVDGLEVVAWDVAPKGLPAEPTKSHSFVAEIEKQGGVISPLVTLSQASSVIAGLKEEKTYWWEKANEENGLRVHLEEEIKRLREALDLAVDWIGAAPHDDHCFTNDPNPDACRCVCGKDTLLDTLDDHNG